MRTKDFKPYHWLEWFCDDNSGPIALFNLENGRVAATDSRFAVVSNETFTCPPFEWPRMDKANKFLLSVPDRPAIKEATITAGSLPNFGECEYAEVS